MHIRDSQTHCTYVYLWAVLCSYAVDTQHCIKIPKCTNNC
uniref:Uncharacterized protein n=1 Tax=Anguilla anguilla TaxID=7936 RepID=A0A0E9PXM1_ANGAN